MNAATTARALAALALLATLSSPFTPNFALADETAPAAASASASSSPVSDTGLLPIFGVAIDFSGMPQKAKPDEAVAAVQKVWDEHMKDAGFNVIQVPMDVRDLGDKGAARLAKLCVWAQANNVRIAPVLYASELGEPVPADYADKVGAFAGKTIELIKAGGGQQAYSQIMYYQLDRPLNHPGNHGPMEASQAAALIAQTIEKLHAAEQTGLAGSSLQATPVMACASFDYEMIRFGAIANVPLTDESYQQAYESLRGYVGAVLGGAPVDVVGIEWFPGSLTSNAVERFPDLITKLQADFPGKLILVHTGYSTAAGGESEQSNYYTQTFNNLSDLRTNQGVESSFAGIVWRTAMDKPEGEPKPPSSKTVEQMAGWNWSDRAAELMRMWNEPGAGSKEMAWWVARVESRFGIMGSGRDISKPGEPKLSYQLLSKLKNSLLAAAMSTGAGQYAQELTSQPGGAKGIASAVKSKLQSALFGMLDAWIAKTTENLVSGGGDDGDGGGGGGSAGGGGAPPPAPATADLRIDGLGLGEGITEIKSGVLTPLLVTVVNQGSAPASNVTLYLRENTSTDLANSTPTTLSPSGTSTITIPWTPSHPGEYKKMALDAYCDNEGDPSSNHVELEDFSVAPGGGGGGGGGGGKHGGIIYAPVGGYRATLVTKTDPGFLKIEQVRGISPVPMMMTMSGGGGGTMTPMMSTGGGGGGGMTPMMSTGGGKGGAPAGKQTASMSYKMESAGPQPISLAFNIANPFNHNFTSVSAILKVNNQQIATKDLGTLFPRQRRTVSFAQWNPPKAGTFPVKIEMTGTGPMGKKLSATANDQITVGGGGSGSGGTAGGSATRSVVKGGGTTPSGSGAMTIGGASGGATTAMSMPVSRTRAMTPMILAPAPTPAMAKEMQTRSLFLAPGGKKLVSGLGMSLFGLTANSITLAPFPAQVGNDVSVSVRLVNSDRTAANKVKVEAFVDDDKLGESVVDVLFGKPVVAAGFKSWKAKPGRHDVRTVVTWGAKSGLATKPIDIKPPHAVGAGGVASLMARGSFSLAPRLTITSADIRLNPPAPAAGGSVELSVRVVNPATSDVKGVRVELFADGASIGTATGDIAAGKDYVFVGFPRWTAVVGKHVLLCRASSGAQITETTRELTVGAAFALVKSVLTTTMTLNPGTTVQPPPPPPATVKLAAPVMRSAMLMAVVLPPDLQILTSDITFSPNPPKPKEPLTITVVVRNIGDGAANGGTVSAVLQVDGAEATRREFPVTIPAKGLTTLVWPLTAPDGKSYTTVATGSIANDANPGNNQAQATSAIQVMLMKQIQPYIQVK